MTKLRNPGAALLALLPMAFAFAGGWLDERAHLGFSNWISACRAQGISFALFTFTVELLPNALLGALAGGIVLQIVGATLLGRDGARATLAAHAGCAFAMVAGLLMCAWIPFIALSIPGMLGVEGALAAGTALLLNRRRRHDCGDATSVELPKPAQPNAY